MFLLTVPQAATPQITFQDLVDGFKNPSRGSTASGVVFAGDNEG